MFDFFKSIFKDQPHIDQETARMCKEKYNEMISAIAKNIKQDDDTVQIERLIQWTIEKMVMIRVSITNDDSDNMLSYLTGQLSILHLLYQVLMKAHGNQDKEYLSDHAIRNFEELVKECEVFSKVQFLTEHMWFRTIIKFQKERAEHHKCDHDDC